MVTVDPAVAAAVVLVIMFAAYVVASVVDIARTVRRVRELPPGEVDWLKVSDLEHTLGIAHSDDSAAACGICRARRELQRLTGNPVKGWPYEGEPW